MRNEGVKKGPGNLDTLHYSEVSPTDAQQLLREAREFVDIPSSEVGGERIVVTTTLFSARGGLVRRAEVVYNMSLGTVDVKTKIVDETAELFHPGH